MGEEIVLVAAYHSRMDDDHEEDLELALQMPLDVALCREFVLTLHQESSETTADTLDDMDT